MRVWRRMFFFYQGVSRLTWTFFYSVGAQEISGAPGMRPNDSYRSGQFLTSSSSPKVIPYLTGYGQLFCSVHRTVSLNILTGFGVGKSRT